MNKKILLVSLLAIGLVGCDDPRESSTPVEPSTPPVESSTPEESTPGYTPDLSANVELKLSVNYQNEKTGMKYQLDNEYSTPAGTQVKKGDWKPVWKTLQSELNFTINDVTPEAGKAVDKFKNDWATDQFADMACGNVSDITKQSVTGGTILNIEEYMEYLPNFSAFLEENPIVRQSITTTKYGTTDETGIYYFPYFDGFADLEKMTLVRADWVRKLLDDELVEGVDTNAGIWTTNEYTPKVADKSYSVTVPESLETTGTKTINKAEVTNIIEQQNALAAADRTGDKMAKQLRDYIDAKYGNQFAKRSDLFLGVDSCYDADEMVALMRVVRVSPARLTGNAAIEVVPFVPREYNNQRIADMYRWAGQLWGVRGVESRMGYLYIDAEGAIQDARGDAKLADVLENLNALYDEGLILKNFQSKAGYGVTDGKYAQSIVVGGNAAYAGFMEYDYSQTQGVWNDKPGSVATEGYDFRPILGGVAKWDDGDEATNYFHFTESWRSVKTQAWCLNANLANDEAKLLRALALADYFYSEEGHVLNSFGPESEGYTSGVINYQGREVPKFTDATLAQLNDPNIGAGSYTNYLRQFVGATLPVGYIKEQGMEYQCTSANAMNGLTIINKAIEVGTYKHVECAMTENPFFTIVPSAMSLSSGDATIVSELEASDKLGLINSNGSTSTWNLWDDYVMYGFGGTKGEAKLETKAQYLEMINTTWKLSDLVLIYNDAYELMIS